MTRRTSGAPAGPVFVVGYMHSGTTLMYNILGRNTSLFSGRGESKFFEFLPTLRARYPDLTEERALREYVELVIRDVLGGLAATGLLRGEDGRPAASAERGDPLDELDPDTVEGLVAAARDRPEHGAVFRAVFDALAARAGASRWLEKTPTHVFHIDAIMALAPDARIIEITRDPRDVLASKKTRRATVWSSSRYSADQRRLKHLEKAYDPFWDALSWKATVAAGRQARARYPDRVHHVAYEELVSDPPRVVEAFCDFLGLPFEPGMIEVDVHNTADWKQGGATGGIYTDSLGRWRDVLTPGEVALCQALLRRELDELGYEAISVTLGQRAAALPILANVAPHIAVRLSRRLRMGGPTLLLQTLSAYRKRLRVLAGGSSG